MKLKWRFKRNNWNRENDKFNEKWNNISVVIWFKKSKWNITWYIYLKCSESVQKFQSMFRMLRLCSVNVKNLFRNFSQCSESVQTLLSQCSESVQNLQSMFRMFSNVRTLFSQCSESVQNFQSMFRIFSNVQTLFSQCSECSESVQNLQSMFRIFSNVQNFQSMLRIISSVQTLFRISSTKTGLFRISLLCIVLHLILIKK